MSANSKTFSTLLSPEPTVPAESQLVVLTALLVVPYLVHIILLVSFLPPLYFLHADYKAFLSLGPGGTPSTPLGYLRIKILSLFALKDPYQPDNVHPHLNPGVLHQIPHRRGSRPKVAGIAPHRQVDQRAGAALFTQLAEALGELASQQCHSLAQGTSCFEKHGTGLFSLSPVVRTCKGEICHIHPSDGSMHMLLHPGDAKVVLEAGWGERHPLARGGWFRRFVPREFVMVYAPRDQTDIETLLKIVCAAAWWVGGKRVDDEFGGAAAERLDVGGAASSPLTCQCGGVARMAVSKLISEA